MSICALGLLDLPSAKAQLGPIPGLAAQTLGQPSGPAQLDAGGTASALNAIASGATASRSLALRAADRLNVLDYMPAGTVTPVNLAVEANTGLVITAGQTTLYTTTNVFSAATAAPGTLIYVPGADVNGKTLATNIAAFVTPTQVTLAAPAATTLGNVPGTLLFGPDATATLTAAINAANAAMATGHMLCIYHPAGAYLITRALPAFNTGMPGCVTGEGPNKSAIDLAPTFAGDLFTWSEAWLGAFHTPGPHVGQLRINGWPAAPSQQNALVFYDRNDNVSIVDFEADNLPGRCIATGLVKNTPANAYVRESHWRGIRCFNDGAPGVPAVEFNSNNGGPGGGDDSSNEISVSHLDIFGANGPALVIRAQYGIIRDLKFESLRIESTNAGTAAADSVQINDTASGYHGVVNDVSFTNAELLNGYSGACQFHVTPTPGPIQTYGIYYQGMMNVGEGCGLRLDGSQGSMKFVLHGMASVGPNVVIGMANGSATIPQSSNLVGGPIVLDGFGAEASWTYAVAPAAVRAVNAPMLQTSPTVLATLTGVDTIPNTAAWANLTQATTQAAETLTLASPNVIQTGKKLDISTAGAITALSFSPTVVGWTNGSPLPAGSGLALRWDGVSWRRVQ